MSFDALTLSAVHDELEPVLIDARVQRVVFVDELSLAVEFFAPQHGRTNVLLSAHLEHGRIQRMRQLKLPARGVEGETPFSLLIRKHLREARVRRVHQPRLERLFELDCEQRDASGRLYRVTLIVEAMGRRSNLVLVGEDGTILDAVRRTPPSRSRRPVLPHLRYAPAPPQDRLVPEELSVDKLRANAAVSTPLAKHLAERVAGLSPLAGRELAFRATGVSDARVDGVDWAHVATIAREFLSVIDTHAWTPCVALNGEQPIDYAPYRLEHLAAAGARIEAFTSISDAMERFYASERYARRGDPLTGERKTLLAPIERTLHATERRIGALSREIDSAQADREPLRRAGEAILAHQAELPPGTTDLVLDGQSVLLDPRLSAVENAQAYFARYRKAKEAEERVPELLEAARRQAEYLRELRALVEVADQMQAIRALRREVMAATGAPARPSRAVERSAPYRRVSLEAGWEALVGSSAEGNVAVTFEVARPEDLWLHARGVPGAHVIVRTDGRTPPDGVIDRAAALAAHHSASRDASAVDVDVVPKRYVKKIPNGPPGLVRYQNERTMRVTPRSI